MSRLTVARLKDYVAKHAERARLAGICRELGIRNKDIAARCRPVVQPSLVSHWFANRSDSSNVAQTVKQMIAAARKRKPAVSA